MNCDKALFVEGIFSQCLAFMIPCIAQAVYVRVADGEAQRELVTIYFENGFSRVIDVTGMDLPQTALAVLRKFEG